MNFGSSSGKPEPGSRDYVAIAVEYAEEVIAGRVAACEYVRLACQRMINDLHRTDIGLHTDRAMSICTFVEMQKHIKGQWRGQPIILEPWQMFTLVNAFGWVTVEDGHRRFRIIYVEVPRKNAKSTLSAPVGLYLMSCDQEGGAEIYSAATTKDQARIVFGDAKRMVELNRELRSHTGLDTTAHAIVHRDSDSVFRALSSDADNLDGLNIHGAIVDEVHAHKDRSVVDVIETGMGARTQPLAWYITTAGVNRAGVCYEMRNGLIKVLRGQVQDDTMFGVIYTIDLPGDLENWNTPEIWKKANPNYGVSVNPKDLMALAKKAESQPSAKAAFLTKRLNVWVSAHAAWMDMVKWDACADESLSIEDFLNDPCWIGVDLASKTDIASVAFLFKRRTRYYLFTKHYVPHAKVWEDDNKDYQGWAEVDRMVVTPGNVIDHDLIEDDIKKFSDRANIRFVGYDPHQAQQMMAHIADHGVPVVEVPQTRGHLSEPMKEFERLVLSHGLVHDNCPVLSWMVSNTIAITDPRNRDIMPGKEVPQNKIDGTVASIIALACALQDNEGESGYDQNPAFFTL